MSSKSSGGGWGLTTIVFIVLLILKLFGVINISWWLVFLPLILGVIFWIGLLLFIFIFSKK